MHLPFVTEAFISLKPRSLARTEPNRTLVPRTTNPRRPFGWGACASRAPSFPLLIRGNTRPAVLSLALEEAEEDGAHQVGCGWGSSIRKGLGVPTFFISLPTVSERWPGSGHRATWAATTARPSCRPPGRLGLTEAGVFPERFPWLSSSPH